MAGGMPPVQQALDCVVMGARNPASEPRQGTSLSPKKPPKEPMWKWCPRGS
jgi:hypothetical protein